MRDGGCGRMGHYSTTFSKLNKKLSFVADRKIVQRIVGTHMLIYVGSDFLHV